MGLSFSILLLTCFILVAFHFWNGMVAGETSLVRLSFLKWVFKGVVVPAVLWIAMNFGISDYLQPFMPEVTLAKYGGGNWGDALRSVTARGLFVIGSYWAAVTLGWLVARDLGGEDSREHIAFSAACGLFLSPLVGLLVYHTGWAGIGMAALVLLLPIAYCLRPLAPARNIPPIYSRAIARINVGKYREAEMEVIRELEETHEDDFEGWMMLAGLYANHFKDLAEAERTIQEICSQPNVTDAQVSIALQRLAYWHLKLGEDPPAARRAYEALCKKLPNSQAARLARQRIRELPATRDLLRDQRRDRPIHMPALNEHLDAAEADAEVNKSEAASRANQLVEQLKDNPNNTAAREELARIFAERLGKNYLAIEQIELLLGMPDQPDKQRAEWLSLMAAWEIKYRHDWEAGRKLLERLIREYPESSQAFAARRRIHLMDEELKARNAKSSATGFSHG